MTRSLLKEKSKNQLSKNFGTLILSVLIFGMITNLPRIIHSIFRNLPFATITISASSLEEIWGKILAKPGFITYASILLLMWVAVFLFTPVLNIGVHHLYLKATTDDKPLFPEMFSKTSQFGTALLSSILMAIFLIFQFLLLIVPGIIACYSYSMVYYILAEHPEFSAMEAIRESKRIMKGHKFELFVLQLSFIWWYLLVLVTFGLAAIYVIPYTEMAKANFYNEIKNM